MAGIVQTLVCAAVRQLAITKYRAGVRMGVVEDGLDFKKNATLVRMYINLQSLFFFISICIRVILLELYDYKKELNALL